ASGKTNKIVAHAGVLPKIFFRWQIAGSIHETRDSVLVRDIKPSPAVDLAAFGCIVVIGHDGIGGECALVVLDRHHLHQAHTREQNGVFELIAMGLLDDHFTARSQTLPGNLVWLYPLGRGDTGSSGEGKRSCRSGGHHRTFATE